MNAAAAAAAKVKVVKISGSACVREFVAKNPSITSPTKIAEGVLKEYDKKVAVAQISSILKKESGEVSTPRTANKELTLKQAVKIVDEIGGLAELAKQIKALEGVAPSLALISKLGGIDAAKSLLEAFGKR